MRKASLSLLTLLFLLISCSKKDRDIFFEDKDQAKSTLPDKSCVKDFSDKNTAIVSQNVLRAAFTWRSDNAVTVQIKTDFNSTLITIPGDIGSFDQPVFFYKEVVVTVFRKGKSCWSQVYPNKRTPVTLPN